MVKEINAYPTATRAGRSAGCGLADAQSVTAGVSAPVE